MSGIGASSPGWETVVSTKTVKAAAANKNKGSAANQAKKKFVERAPRLEDVLPMDQVNAIYNENGMARPQEQPKPTPPVSPGKATASPGKATKAKKAKKKNDEVAPVPSKPKTLEVAVKQFQTNEFKSGLEQTLRYYSTNPVMWVREAAAVLNECLASVEPPVDYANDLFSSRPLACLTKEMKKTLASLLEEAGPAARQAGYEALVANLAYDLAKSTGANVNGYLILIQMMAETSPQLALSNVKRVADLIHSYQNQAGVCVPLLWALGQSGKTDLSVGVKVWVEFMKPLLRLKHYSRHVVTYITGIWAHHHTPKTLEKRVLYAQQFFDIFDAMFNESSNLSKELQKELQSVFPVVKASSIGDCSLDHELFPEFLKRMSNLSLLEGSDDCRNLMTDCMAECLANNPMAVVSHWQQMYRSHFPASALVLDQLGSKIYTKKIAHSKQVLHNAEHLEGLIEAFQEYNTTCPSQREGLAAAKRGCKNILANLKNMQSSANSGSGLPYKTLILVLAVGLGLVVNNDIERKGSFKASSTGLFLQDVGLYDRTVEAFQYTLETYETSRDLAEHYVPIYVNQTRENVGPMLSKAAGHAQWAWAETKVYGNKAVEKANEYLPGAKEKMMVYGSQATKLIGEYSEWVMVQSKVWSNLGSKMAADALKSSKATMQDIVDGKIELKDVYNGVVDLSSKALLRLEELRLSYTNNK